MSQPIIPVMTSTSYFTTDPTDHQRITDWLAEHKLDQVFYASFLNHAIAIAENAKQYGFPKQGHEHALLIVLTDIPAQTTGFTDAMCAYGNDHWSGGFKAGLLKLGKDGQAPSNTQIKNAHQRLAELLYTSVNDQEKLAELGLNWAPPPKKKLNKKRSKEQKRAKENLATQVEGMGFGEEDEVEEDEVEESTME